MHALNAAQMIRMMGNSMNNSLEAEIEFGSAMFYVYVGISCFLVIFAGIMSGLTLGLMSLGLVELEILQRSGTPTEKKQAVLDNLDSNNMLFGTLGLLISNIGFMSSAVIFPVVQKQHQLLVTLLLCNAAAMEALPIYLDKIFNQVVAIVLSVTFVLFFGEVIPQAVCTRYGLAIGSSFIWLVKFLMIACYPIAYPIGKMLDWVLGHNDALFRRAQLKALVSIHGQEAGKGGELTHDETTIISGALDLTEKTAEEAMTPIESTFSLDVNSKLDWEAMGKILARGHSRVPVYSGNPRNIIGLLLVKSLLTVRAETETPVSAVSIRRIPRVPADMPLYDILNEFQKGSSHMAAVVKTKGKSRKPPTLEEEPNEERVTFQYSQSATPNRSSKQGDKAESVTIDVETAARLTAQTNGVPYSAEDIEEGEVIGIITLEDVFEELLQEEIVDETDEFVDVHKRIRVAAAAAASSVARAPSIRRLTAIAQSGQNKPAQTPRKPGDEDSTSKLQGALVEPLLKKETCLEEAEKKWIFSNKKVFIQSYSRKITYNGITSWTFPHQKPLMVCFQFYPWVWVLYMGLRMAVIAEFRSNNCVFTLSEFSYLDGLVIMYIQVFQCHNAAGSHDRSDQQQAWEVLDYSYWIFRLEFCTLNLKDYSPQTLWTTYPAPDQCTQDLQPSGSTDAHGPGVSTPSSRRRQHQFCDHVVDPPETTSVGHTGSLQQTAGQWLWHFEGAISGTGLPNGSNNVVRNRLTHASHKRRLMQMVIAAIGLQPDETKIKVMENDSEPVLLQDQTYKRVRKQSGPLDAGVDNHGGEVVHVHIGTHASQLPPEFLHPFAAKKLVIGFDCKKLPPLFLG
ncbi:hypothetical protein CTI12_AA323490 [Artemisia annua]|uniref:CNNM transmembrane domain-containing protein n=1 Tax=Artemisia annua TaxID=35608 RepID=A0A2U1MZ84_ARTAN|nr:hypothetical protein CTI12_AA323490 [Artemisia annua]